MEATNSNEIDEKQAVIVEAEQLRKCRWLPDPALRYSRPSWIFTQLTIKLCWQPTSNH
jgi:hypothetical protein